ncbi:type III secretion system domain-containing protein [Pseudomonas chlororaphis]|uniref:type III secretion system domain-containing protein n=1 Tax=Pseudomonas chlororaphis TaxID=587753 RepID=UPI0015DFB47E|nr:type III secretion system domain-containing protein [Pseudomonas chlororaphis]QLL13462.1 hypothetical protein H0I86_31655 [Pseudomonas chlororaphis subsp. aurantiaca]
MSGPLHKEVKRLHRLAWQPGAWLDTSWWSSLGLADWEALYARHVSCRPAIDAALVARRGYPDGPLPGSLNARQTALLALEPRLVTLTTALGLIALDCPEYLLLREHRQALSPRLGDRACEQLFALHRGWNALPAIENNASLNETVLQAGTQWLTRQAGSCAVTHALLGLLPFATNSVSDSHGPKPSGTASAQDWLIKIGRFL